MRIAKLTARHKLYIAQAGIPSAKPGPHDPGYEIGTWGSWILDGNGKLVPASQFRLGIGDFDESYMRAAYDSSALLLQAIRDPEPIIPYDDLQWS